MIPPIYKDEDVSEAMTNIIAFGMGCLIIGKKMGLYEALNVLDFEGYDYPNREEIKRVYNLYSRRFSVMTSIDKERAYYFRASRKSYKSDRDEIIAICGESAIRSIVGAKEYAKCSRRLVLSRMAGFAKGEDESRLPEQIKRLSGEGGKRQWRKLMASLKYAGCSIYVPKGCHGFYASFKLSPVELAVNVERKLMERKPKTEYDLSSKDLRAEALKRINNGVPHK